MFSQQKLLVLLIAVSKSEGKKDQLDKGVVQNIAAVNDALAELSPTSQERAHKVDSALSTDDNHERIESAFHSSFHRAPAPPPPPPTEEEEQPKGEHEFEVIVCHANVIRYWMCRYVSIF